LPQARIMLQARATFYGPEGLCLYRIPFLNLRVVIRLLIDGYSNLTFRLDVPNFFIFRGAY
jgi:hypothetical protein